VVILTDGSSQRWSGGCEAVTADETRQGGAFERGGDSVGWEWARREAGGL
jgi:hypothetical protein